MAPIDIEHIKCSTAATIDGLASPKSPAWAQPMAPTQAIFVATSLQESYTNGFQGMQAIEALAEKSGIPVTWMVGNPQFVTQNTAYYNQVHSGNGDDVEFEVNSNLDMLGPSLFLWYTPAAAVLGAGKERNISGALALGDLGFWGITWNSHGTDSTSDEGTPWGTYCADVNSYKRPSPDGSCNLVAFEWTARDLTRAYLTDTNADGYSAEAAFSTDPDDLLQRGGFDPTSAAAYIRAMVDAYAAAGVSQPIVMMSQQESTDEGTYQANNDVVLGALYQQAAHDGMKALTLRQAVAQAKTCSAAPRAIAFPFIAGGRTTTYNNVNFTPATIDFHDSVAGMTFIAGHTLPSRLFEYAEDPTSTFNTPLQEILPGNPSLPTLTGVTFANGSLSFSFNAPQSLHFGVALWSDPSILKLSGANVVPAGHAGVVVTFDLPAGPSIQTVPCGGCQSTTFAYST